MTARSFSTAVFGAGLTLGVFVGYLAGIVVSNRGPSYELADDVTLRHGGGNPPAVTLLRAGQQFDVTSRKADVNYIRIYGATYDRDLLGHTLDAKTKLRTKEAPWDSATRTEQRHRPRP